MFFVVPYPLGEGAGVERRRCAQGGAWPPWRKIMALNPEGECLPFFFGLWAAGLPALPGLGDVSRSHLHDSLQS